MPVWWYPCSRMSCVPASTRAAFVVALALGPVSAVACSAIDCLLHTEIIDQSVTLVKARVGYLEKNSRALGRGAHDIPSAPAVRHADPRERAVVRCVCGSLHGREAWGRPALGQRWVSTPAHAVDGARREAALATSAAVSSPQNSS